MPESIISLKNVSWSYARSGAWALKNISLEIRRGECIAVMGENGSGKSTFCKLLNGIIPHSQAGHLVGTVSVDGLFTAESSVAELSRKTGMALDDPDSQVFTARVRDEIAFGLENLLFPPDEIQSRLGNVLERVGLSPYADSPPNSLSGGQKQRLVIAAALAMAGTILVLDEPVSQLDPAGAKEVLSLVREIRQGGLTVVMATHSSDEAAEFADRVLVLKEGRVAACDTPQRVFAEPRLADEYGIQPPFVSELAQCLRERGAVLPAVPLAFDDAKNVFIEWLHGQNSPAAVSVVKTTETTLPEKPAAIQAEHLCFSFNNNSNKTLNDVNITIFDNEFVAIAGQNGSGKTTLLKNICGLLRPDYGKIIVRGKNANDMSVAAISAEIGFVMQNPDRQLFAATVYEEVSFALHNAQLPPGEARRRTEESLAAVGLWEQRDAFPPALGKGQRARAVIAAVLAMGSKIIILDEPAAGQDYAGCRMVMETAQKLHESGCTVVFVTHNMSLAAEYAHRIIVLKDGGVFMDGKPEAIFSRHGELLQAHLLPPPVALMAGELRCKIYFENIPLNAGELAEMMVSGG